MSGSENPLEPIRLDQPVSVEQYNTMAGLLALAMDRFGRERGWCSERHYVFQGILPEYTQYADRMITPIPDYTDAQILADRAHDVRGRILWYVNNRNSELSLAKANELLRTAGLPEFPESGLVPTSANVCQYCGRDHGHSGITYVVPDSEVVVPTYIPD